jgi:peptide/nickel transport system substrate-binding protein
MEEKTMKSSRRLALAAGIAVIALSLASCAGADEPAATGEPTDSARGEVLRLGAADDIQSWNTTASNRGQITQAFQAPYDTLIRQLPNGDFAPMLATAWEWNEDRTVLTLDLESGVTFSDGEEFDAEAVKANLEHFKAGAGPQTSQLSVLDTVEVVDDDTVTMTLSEPDPAMEYYLSEAAGLMASPAAIEAGTLDQVPVGTGPYVLDTDATVAGSQYVFTAREDYWSPDLQKFDRVELLYLDDTARVNALVSGQVDAAQVEADALPQIEGAGMSVVTTTSDWEGIIIFDRDGELVPALADARVRQAINYAIDRATLNEAQQSGAAELTTQIFAPESGSYVEELNEAYPFDPERARELLAEAGYADGFEIVAPVPDFLAGPWALIGQYLSDVGITVVQETVPFQDFRNDIAAGNYPVAMFRFGTSDPWGNSIRSYISTRAGVWNPFQTQTDELDELIREVQYGGEEYQELAQAVNEYVVDEAWFAPLYRAVQSYAHDGATITVEPQAGLPVPALYNFSPASN